jgi:hypothetical protein
LPVLYPAGLTGGIQLVLGTLVIAVNAVVYAMLLRRWRSGTAASAPSA